jgi:hypothetical protein
MTKHSITQGELSTLLYCLESQAVDFKDGEESTLDFNAVFAKLESLADKTPNPNQLDQTVLTISLV